MKSSTIENNVKLLERELALVRVEAAGARQDEALSIVGAWSGRLLELGPDHFTAEISAAPDRISRFLDALAPLGLAESLRTGTISVVVG